MNRDPYSRRLTLWEHAREAFYGVIDWWENLWAPPHIKEIRRQFKRWRKTGDWR